MPLKDLSGKSIYDLAWEDFITLFCQQCRYLAGEMCDKDPKSVNICMQLIDQGIWDSLFRKRLG